MKLTHATEDAVGHKRLKQVDVFISALDNVAARQTLERIAHMYKKPMIDGGTDGFDGTQYNFIPLQTAEYPLDFLFADLSLFYLTFRSILQPTRQS